MDVRLWAANAKRGTRNEKRETFLLHLISAFARIRTELSRASQPWVNRINYPARAKKCITPESEQEAIMAWNGEERRAGKDRRILERRRTTHYHVNTLVV